MSYALAGIFCDCSIREYSTCIGFHFIVHTKIYHCNPKSTSDHVASIFYHGELDSQLQMIPDSIGTLYTGITNYTIPIS